MLFDDKMTVEGRLEKKEKIKGLHNSSPSPTPNVLFIVDTQRPLCFDADDNHLLLVCKILGPCGKAQRTGSAHQEIGGVAARGNKLK